MTATTPSSPPQYAPVTAAPLSRAMIAAVVLVIVQTATVLVGRLIAVNLSTLDGTDSTALASTLGVFGLLSIVVVGAAIVTGHIALSQTRGDARRGRILAAVALGGAYLHLLFWANRIVLAIIAAANTNDPTQFLANVFWWA